MNAEFQRIARRDKKAFLSEKCKEIKENISTTEWEFQRIASRCKKALLNEKCKEIEENNRMGKARGLFKKLEISRENLMHGWVQ